MADQDEQAKVQEIEAEAQKLREDIAQAKATGVQAGSEEAKELEERVHNIEMEAKKLSPAAFNDLQQIDDHRIM